MYKIKYLLFSVLCFCLLGGALSVAAQTKDEVLFSSGANSVRQSEVDELIAFYEWAFESEFSPAQRRQYRDYVVREFRGNPVASQIAMTDLLSAFSKIKTLDEAAQQRRRNVFTGDFVSEIKDRTDDEGGRFLLGIYDRAQKNAGNLALKP